MDSEEKEKEMLGVVEDEPEKTRRQQARNEAARAGLIQQRTIT